jgi:hypothetical protein
VVAGSGPNWRNGTILFQTEDRSNAFLKVANLTMSPMRLLHPSVVARVIYGNIRWRSRANAAGSLEGAS